MIVYITRNGPPEAMLCPVVMCDYCRTPIQGADRPGIVIWRNVERDPGNPTFRADDAARQEIATVHKGRCDRAYEATRPGAWLWEELGVFLVQLISNTDEPFPVEPNVEYIAPPPSTWRIGHYDRGKR